MDDDIFPDIAPPYYIWVCTACGRTARDRCNGTGGWDESCMTHAVLCFENKNADAWVAAQKPTTAERAKTAAIAVLEKLEERRDIGEELQAIRREYVQCWAEIVGELTDIIAKAIDPKA